MSKACGCDLPPMPKFPNKALQLPPCPPVAFHKKQFPASIGDDTTNPPEEMDYKNVILEYQANGHVYIYSSDGVPTRIDGFDADDFLKKLEELGTKIEEEVVTREEADRLINQKLEQHDAELASQGQAIEDIEGRIDKSVQLDTLVSNDASTVTIGKRLGGLGTIGVLTNMPLPVASSTAAGVMNAALYKAVQLNSENVDALLGGAVALEGLDADIAQGALTTAWKQATQRANLVNRASILDVTNKKVWYYYENINEWFAIPVGDASVTVSIATNDTPGIVKGSTVAGQIAVEADGTMSLNGYDGLTHDIENLTALMPTVKNEYGSSETDAISQAFISDKLNGRYVAIGQGTTFSTSSLDTPSVVIGNKAKAGRASAAVVIGNEAGSDDHSMSGSVYIGNYATPVASAYGSNAIAIGGGSKASTQCVVVGVSAKLKDDSQNTTIVGYRSEIDEHCGGATVIGAQAKASAGSTTALGTGAEATHEQSVALGSSAKTGRAYEVSVGDPSRTLESNRYRYLANVKAGELPNDAVNLKQVQDMLADAGGGKLYSEYGDNEDGALTQKFVSDKLNSGQVLIGQYAMNVNNSAVNPVAIGQYTAATTRATALGYNATVLNTDSVALGSVAKTTRVGEVSVGNIDRDEEAYRHRYIANVRAGELPEDAVNLQQMQEYVAEHGGGDVPERAKNLPQYVMGGASASQSNSLDKWTYQSDFVSPHFEFFNLDDRGQHGFSGAQLNSATTTTAGVMSAADKTKLDSLGEAMTVEEFNLAWEAA